MDAYIPFNQVRYALIFCISYGQQNRNRIRRWNTPKGFQSYFCAMSH